MAKSGIGGVVILSCDCTQPFQDKMYGSGKRVHNLKKTGVDANCTGCGTKHSTGRAALADKKKADKEDMKAKEEKPVARKQEKKGNKK